MTAASQSPLVVAATTAIIKSENTKFPMQEFVAERYAQAALDACHAEEMVAILKRLTAPYTGDPGGEPLDAIISDAESLLDKLDGTAEGAV